MTRIGIAGVTGRMGQLLVAEVGACGAHLSGGTARRVRDGSDELGVAMFDDLPMMARESDVIIDFSHADAVQGHAAALTDELTPWVLGTSGLSASDEAVVARAARLIPICYAANFSPGVNLVLALAQRMGAALPGDIYDAEILEMHHRQKVDAPSGTAVALGRAVAKGRGVALSDVAQRGRDGHTGPRPTGAIGFASLRGGQVVGEHTLLFASSSEQIVLTHRAFDRRVFATGAVRAALWLRGRPPGLYGMADVLGLGGG